MRAECGIPSRSITGVGSALGGEEASVAGAATGAAIEATTTTGAVA